MKDIATDNPQTPQRRDNPSKSIQDLTKEVKDIINDDVDLDMRSILETLAELPPAESRVDQALRNLLLEMAVENYLDNKAKNLRKAKP